MLLGLRGSRGPPLEDGGRGRRRVCVCARVCERARACVLCIWSGARAGSLPPSSFAQDSLGKLFPVKLLRPGGKRPAVGRLPGERVL